MALRKVLGRLMDRRGANTSLRRFGLYCGGTAGEWWRKLPFGLEAQGA